MEKYRNINGSSGIRSFEIGDDNIKIWFSTSKYTYSYRKAGKFHVDQMKILAQRGGGLNSYINKNVKNLYD